MQGSEVSTVITVIEVIFLFFFAIVAENLVLWKERQDIDMLYFNLYDKITLIIYDHVVQFILH